MLASALHPLWEAGFQGVIVGTEVYEEAVLEKQQPQKPKWKGVLLLLEAG